MSRATGTAGTDEAVREPEGSAGFTLIEVMISMVLLAIGMLGMAAAQMYTLRYSADADNRSQAMYLAEEQMALFMAMPRNDIRLTSTVGGDGGPIVLASAVVDTRAVSANASGVGETTAFTRTWTVAQPPVPGLQNQLRRIRVTVAWNSNVVGQSSVTLEGVR